MQNVQKLDDRTPARNYWSEKRRVTVELRRLDLDSADARRILSSWHMGHDTQQIAGQLGLAEAVIFNTLHHLRERERQQRAVNSTMRHLRGRP